MMFSRYELKPIDSPQDKRDSLASKVQTGVPSKGAKLCKEEDFLFHGRLSGNGKGENEA